MPDLTTKLHVKMLQRAKNSGQVARDGLYGLHWGDPESPASKPLQAIRDHWLLPYVDPAKIALEIGPGGGRWTRYMLGFQRLYVVDYHAELLAELRRNFPQENIVEIHNNGTDFPGVAEHSIDFVFSFGVFVHLEMYIIEGYLANLRGIVHPDTPIVIQYSDKDKPRAQRNATFSNNNPRRMRKMVEAAGYRILEEDNASLDHSAIMRFQLA